MDNYTFQPVIKWTGSKRSQAEEIIKHFPYEINAYYEPFVGGGSVVRRLLTSPIHKVNHFVCSDLNSDLIDLWNLIKTNPILIAETYSRMWHKLNANDDKEQKKEYFYKDRDRFNSFKDPLDFMFIMRTTTNGMPRYNQKGEFNNSFHVTRDGINPKTLKNILLHWSELLNKHNVQFVAQDYKKISPSKDDFCYFDPPYAGTKGMYYGALNYEDLWDWLRKLKCEYVLSFSGVNGKKDKTFDVPKDVYSRHQYILSGNSSFKRIVAGDCCNIVHESLYVKTDEN